jgi:hypothetical protein
MTNPKSTEMHLISIKNKINLILQLAESASEEAVPTPISYASVPDPASVVALLNVEIIQFKYGDRI